jgi:hypothetical protein
MSKPMRKCETCGFPVAAGERWCTFCGEGRGESAAARRPPPTEGEVAQACNDGRLARLEDEVATLRRVCSGLTGQVAELLRGRCMQGEPVAEGAYCDEGGVRDEEVRP